MKKIQNNFNTKEKYKFFGVTEMRKETRIYCAC